MWYPAEFAFNSYFPDELQEGMLFINRISVGVIEPYIELFELEEVPGDMDKFMSKHGAPVELIIVDEDNKVLARQDEIGWWDEGDDSDEYRDVTLDDINYLLREFEGYVDIEYDEDEGVVFIEDRVILSLVPDEEIEEWEETLDDELEEE
jgi:hypothetical protein